MRSIESSFAVRCELSAVFAEDRCVPLAVWRRADVTGRRPLLLLGHGGSQHKMAPPVQQLAELFAGRHGFVVAAIDGPIHGARREPLATGPERQREFLSLWARDDCIDSMVTDWRAALAALLARDDVDGSAIGWSGVSMGTAYGIPLLAAESRIRAAVLGVWGADHVNSERLARLAPQVGCPLLFMMKWQDQLFTRQGQLELFDRLGSARKWLKAYPGEHTQLDTDQIADLEAFLVPHLLS
jgi:dienelactone hydrolase